MIKSRFGIYMGDLSSVSFHWQQVIDVPFLLTKTED